MLEGYEIQEHGQTVYFATDRGKFEREAVKHATNPGIKFYLNGKPLSFKDFAR